MKTIVHMDAMSQELRSFILPHQNVEVYFNSSDMLTFTCWRYPSRNLFEDFVLGIMEPHYFFGENIKRSHFKKDMLSHGITFLNPSKLIN
jgi:hypothetical protein